MKCCYGLTNTSVSDLYFLIGEKFDVFWQKVDKKPKIAVILGVRNIGRNAEYLQNSRVLVIDAQIRFRGYNIPLLDVKEDLTKEKLQILLGKSNVPSYTPPKTDVTAMVLRRVKKTSITHLLLQAKYKSGSKRKEFEIAFLQAIYGNTQEITKFGEASKPIIDWLLTDNGKHLTQTLLSKHPDQTAEKYGIPLFDLHYIETMKKRLGLNGIQHVPAIVGNSLVRVSK